MPDFKELNGRQSVASGAMLYGQGKQGARIISQSCTADAANFAANRFYMIVGDPPDPPGTSRQPNKPMQVQQGLSPGPSKSRLAAAAPCLW